MSNIEPTKNYVYQYYPARDGERIYCVGGPDSTNEFPPKRMTNEEAKKEVDRLNIINQRA